MSDTKKTRAQERERLTRIIDHARAGMTMTEIVDLEGLDPGNTKRWHKAIREAGVKINMGRTATVPLGLNARNDWWRWRLGRSLARVRDAHPQIEVSRMIGMTNAEINAAVKQRGFCTHNWTVSQIQRLADAQGVSFEQLVVGSFTDTVKDKYR